MKPNDDPQKVAKDFCIQNNIEHDIEEKIMAYIVNNLPADKKPFNTTSVNNKSGSQSCKHSDGNPMTDLEKCRRNAFNPGSKYAGKNI